MPDSNAAVLLASSPRLNEIQNDNTSADAYARPPLPKGLCYDAEGMVRIRPDIEARLDVHRLGVAYQLIIQGRHSEANSYIGCHLIHKVLKRCKHWHEAHLAAIRCGKMFVCRDCAAANSRVSRFRYEHPDLYEHLISTQFSVLTFTIEETTRHLKDWIDLPNNLTRAQAQFRRFMDLYPKGDHGWYFLIAFNDHEDDPELGHRTKFFAIHAGDRLPGWRTLDAQWKRIAGADATLRTKLYDGKDGDDQSKGLKLAFSGFDAYYEAADAVGGWCEIDMSEAFGRYSTAMPYGAFRGFEETPAAYSPTDDELVEPESMPAQETCGTCHEPLIRDDKPLLLTIDEVLAKGARIFSHRVPPSYRRKVRPEGCTCPEHERDDG